MKNHRLLRKRKLKKPKQNPRIPRTIHAVSLKEGGCGLWQNGYKAGTGRHMMQCTEWRMEKAEACRYHIQLMQELTAQDLSLSSSWFSPVNVPDILYSYLLQALVQVHAVLQP